MDMQSLLQAGVFLQTYGLTSGRLASVVAGLVGLISVVIGWVVLARPARPLGYLRRGSILALVMGLTGMVLSGLRLILTAGSSIGTGSGKLGAIVALVLGMTGMILGWLGLTRSRRTGMRSSTTATAGPREKT